MNKSLTLAEPESVLSLFFLVQENGIMNIGYCGNLLVLTLGASYAVALCICGKREQHLF